MGGIWDASFAGEGRKEINFQAYNYLHDEFKTWTCAFALVGVQRSASLLGEERGRERGSLPNLLPSRKMCGNK